MFTLTPFLSGANPTGHFDKVNSICAEIAQASRKACKRESDGTFWRAVRSCMGFPDRVAQEACIRIAGERRKHARSDCLNRFKTELKSCEARPENPTDENSQYPD